jgi:myo-inositol-1-phosphate synthase
MTESPTIRSAIGRLGILLPGLGAVATTAIAGAFLVRKGLATGVGSLTQLGTMKLAGVGGRRSAKMADVVPLAALEDIEFGAWDIFPDDAFVVAQHAGVLEARDLNAIRDELLRIRPMRAAFYPEYVRRLRGPHVKTASTKAAMVEDLRDDIRTFRATRACPRLVAIWCGSTEVHQPTGPVHASIRAFEEGLRSSAPDIVPSQLYAWACILEEVPFGNVAPNFAVDFPAALALARERGVPLAGKDLKGTHAMLEAVIAPALAARALELTGWYSFAFSGSTRRSRASDQRCAPIREESSDDRLEDSHRPLTSRAIVQQVFLECSPPRAEEVWDAIDLTGWLGYPMQLKINALCPEPLLAAPLVLDIALLLDLAHRAGLNGPQDWLAFYFTRPMTESGLRAQHDLTAQLSNLHATLRWMVGHDVDTGGDARVYTD